MLEHSQNSYFRSMQKIVSKYRESAQIWPATAKQIANWAIENKEWNIGKKSLIEKCAEDIARAMREEYYVDPQGRTVRTKHAARIISGSVQMTLWADIRTASPEHMLTAFQQRRQQIFGDCKQLKTDIDSYNENVKPKETIQLIFDFTRDLAEFEILRQAS